MDELSWNGLVTFDSRVDRAIIGSLRSRDLSGFEIWRWLGSEQGAEGLLTESNLYPTLYRLEAERLLQSDWHEEERTRRRYRLTATALRRAAENGWPALAFRGGHAPPGEGEPRRSATSPDPETGSWFVPPRPDGAARDDGGPAAISPGEDPARSAAINGYSRELDASLDLPETERNRVRQEVADHIADSASSLEHNGMDATTATRSALDHLGEAQVLATRIERAQQTEDRRNRAIRRAVIELVGEMVLWLMLAVPVFVLAPGIADVITKLSGFVGLDLVVLRSSEWTTNQAAIMVCIGAFAAGRLSMGHLARISRHRDSTFRRPWAAIGALAVLTVALVLPGYQDWLVVATLLATPVAFIAGTFRPKHAGESSYNLRAIGGAIVVVAAVAFLPAVRLFAYDPNGTPGAPLVQGDAQGELSVNQLRDGTFEFTASTNRPGVLSVELWAATANGPFIVVDQSGPGPTQVGAKAVDLATLPPYRAWWAAAVVTGPDGKRMAIAVAIQTGASPAPGTALGWLISKL
ncbi:MAG: helix-turn-helix transcriptional regulator [Candidatus Limnocylindrales bacterium]